MPDNPDSPQEIEQLFRNFCLNEVQHDSTVNRYSEVLNGENIRYAKFKKEKGYERNTFSTTDISVIENFYKRTLSGGDLSQWNRDNDNSQLSASLGKYLNFLHKHHSTNESTISSNETNNKPMINLNQILYGPPGTGKTYNTINKALEIVVEKEHDAGISELLKKSPPTEGEREQLKQKFEQYRKAGQIEFVTFHQSYGYEEFVEGIGVSLEDKEKLLYEKKQGVFKKICKKAEAKDSSIISIDEKIQKLILYLQEQEEGYIVLETKAQKAKFELRYYGYSAFYAKPLKGKYENPVTIKAIKKLYRDNSIKDGEQQVYFKSYTLPVIDYLKNNFGLSDYKETFNDNNKNYVLIIDEINRGNISKIFGELITLIEPSKRIGKKEELKVTLPYSNNEEEFGVPKNLYIIGTMNTADRSIALLDTALRRRFVFEEMMPNYQLLKDRLVGEIDLCKMLKTINNRIESLYDRDHTIGHSYFLDIETMDDLANVFKNKIIPLLQEYFYEDWEKIRVILSDNQKKEESLQFIRQRKMDSNLLGSYDGFDSDKKLYEINKDSFDKPESYQQIYQ